MFCLCYFGPSHSLIRIPRAFLMPKYFSQKPVHLRYLTSLGVEQAKLTGLRLGEYTHTAYLVLQK